MPNIGFQASECHKGGKLQSASYIYQPESDCWKIMREGEVCLELGPGYVPVKVNACGVCATDLARHHLPFPLPQITGHEVLGETTAGPVVIDINASHQARAYQVESCAYCSAGLPSHCPERVTLGIDRLPGGFAPFVLAPKNGIYALGNVSREVATLTEPLAAAMQALKLSAPRDQDKVAVLGPRRLGMLLLTALAVHKERTGSHFDITAITRHANLLALSALFGADKGLHGRVVPQESLREKFDIVYDTTGNPDGLLQALNMSRRVVHLKSTHGRQVMGLNHLGDLVVEELSILPLSEHALSFAWPGETRNNANVLVTPGVPSNMLPNLPGQKYHVLSPREAARKLKAPEFLEGSPLPQFDLAIISSLAEMDVILKPGKGKRSLVRPRGAILLAPLFGETPLEDAINGRNLEIHSSRCGNFPEALALLDEYPYMAQLMIEELITHRFPASQLEQALALAADGNAAIKVVVEHTH